MKKVQNQIHHSDQGNRKRDLMLKPDVATVILQLSDLGWGAQKIADELCISKTTVKSYRRKGGWKPYQRGPRPKALDGLDDWLKASFTKHKGNADVVRQDLEKEHGIHVSLRTVERGVASFRRQLEAEAKATLRFETAPGQQLQIDFGSTTITIAGVKTRIHLFVATLGYSRRPFVMAFRHERQSAWIQGLEGSFNYFRGVPKELLMDNAKALVTNHDNQSREVIFNDRFHAFSAYWGVVPKACFPRRARTKGKDESGVKYVKRNAIAGHQFESWNHLESHLAWWMREIADVRIHGTTGEKPLDRFHAEESEALSPLNGRAPFLQIREFTRKVTHEACVDVDTNAYSVPWQLIGETVTVQVADNEVMITNARGVIARHPLNKNIRQRIINPDHLEGIVGSTPIKTLSETSGLLPDGLQDSELLRPLSIYESCAGGAWA